MNKKTANSPARSLMPRVYRLRIVQVGLGIVIGLTASAALFAVRPREVAVAPAAPRTLLSDCDGAIGELVVHYTADGAAAIEPIYHEFVRQLPDDVLVHVVCPSAADFDRLSSSLGNQGGRLAPLVVDHPITCWSRDRWLAVELSRSTAGQPVVELCPPRGEQTTSAWAARRGDGLTAGDLAAALAPEVSVEPSELFFDGGDFVADDETVFVTPAVLQRNRQVTVDDREELLVRLGNLVGRRVVLLDEAPPHHAGMFMMPVGNRTMLVADPAAAKPFLASVPDDVLGLPGGADFSAATQALFDAVADQCGRAGYRVIRIPAAPAADGRTYLTYVNGILDQRQGRRIVYMPTFSAVPQLNAAATAVWQQVGYEVRPIPCDSCYQHYGTLRCLVNVLRRGDSK